MSSSTSGSTSIHTPLSQVLPWRHDKSDETILISDTVQSDGRFVLCTLAAAASHAKLPVLWLCCGALTDQLTLAALKKIGYDKSSIALASLPDRVPLSSSSSSSSSLPMQRTGVSTSGEAAQPLPSLTIRSIPTLLDQALALLVSTSSSSNDQDQQQQFLDEEQFAKQLYGLVNDWVQSLLSPRDTVMNGAWIILDDVSTLATLMGEQLTYGLILSLQALVSEMSPLSTGLAMRHANDADYHAAAASATSAVVHATNASTNTLNRRNTDWFVGGGVAEHDDDNGRSWERNLVELADIVVDVLPLPSGVSREAHGRLHFTGRSLNVSQMYNYCLVDTQVLVIRLHHNQSKGSR